MNVSKKSLSQLKPVTLIGAGKMGMAMAKGWLKNGLKAESLTLVDPNPHIDVVRFVSKNNIALVPFCEQSDIGILVLAIKPQIMADVLLSLKDLISQETLILSIATGFDIASLQQGLASKNIVRAMPNTPAQIGKGVSGIVASPFVTDKDRAIINALLSACGTVEWLESEADLDALLLVSGCGPAYVFYLVEAMAAAGIEQGLEPKQAMALARQTIIGAAALLEAEPIDASILRQNVTSKGGVTEAALSVLMGEGGFKDLLSKAYKKGLERNKQLGEK
ncbi:MAG: pyrroline-5-carboxylate reductase [Devosiaceae bacterium]|nr:pyrroline-5-carboxylate reductase [Devosiaceae bacterium]